MWLPSRRGHRFGPLRGTVTLGLLWGGWHFFLYAPGWISAGTVAGVVNTAIFVGFTVSVSVLFTWLSNNTRASLLLVMLLHGSINGTATYLQVLADRGIIATDTAAFSTGIGTLLAAVLAAVVIAVLSRRRLSYPWYRYEAERLDLENA